MILPNFLVVGAEKAGSRTLNRVLSGHPEIFMSPVREPRFFTSKNWGRGIQWYSTLFEDATSEKAIGETSPGYTWFPMSKDTPRLVHETLGDIKYVYIVREPIERMISHYNHARFCRWIKVDTPIEKATEEGSMLRECSKYYTQIRHYMPYSSRDKWHVPVLEEMQSRPAEVQGNLFEFLGVDSSFQIEPPRENALKDKKQMPPWYGSAYRVLRKTRFAFPEPLRRLMWKSRSCIGKKLETTEVPDGFEDSMRDEFRVEVEELSEFTEKDLVKLWGYD